MVHETPSVGQLCHHYSPTDYPRHLGYVQRVAPESKTDFTQNFDTNQLRNHFTINNSAISNDRSIPGGSQVQTEAPDLDRNVKNGFGPDRRRQGHFLRGPA
uniref:Uncharacterized protein n=1 Tax=Cacopsylla melanoneura TaxID=428564 RepID=A0A8D8ZTN3_9HEMI